MFLERWIFNFYANGYKIYNVSAREWGKPSFMSVGDMGIYCTSTKTISSGSTTIYMDVSATFDVLSSVTLTPLSNGGYTVNLRYILNTFSPSDIELAVTNSDSNSKWCRIMIIGHLKQNWILPF